MQTTRLSSLLGVQRFAGRMWMSSTFVRCKRCHLLGGLVEGNLGKNGLLQRQQKRSAKKGVGNEQR